jgi:hypothetical protein
MTGQEQGVMGVAFFSSPFFFSSPALYCIIAHCEAQDVFGLAWWFSVVFFWVGWQCLLDSLFFFSILVSVGEVLASELKSNELINTSFANMTTNCAHLRSASFFQRERLGASSGIQSSSDM